VLFQNLLPVLFEVVLDGTPELLVNDGRESDEARGELIVNGCYCFGKDKDGRRKGNGVNKQEEVRGSAFIVLGQ
jgi:hypothetical protein